MPSPSLALLRTQSDARLVELASGGHERAFEAIVERYRRPLLRAARRVLPEARAEDALQQALINAWSALQRGDDVRDLRSWLYRIVHRTALNALRVSGYDYDELNETLRIADAGDDELERRAVVRQTLASLAALPERQRDALLRTAVSGYSQEEVARDLGISDNALRQLVHRARVSMRTAITALTPLPLVTAAAGSPRGGLLADRIAELAAGAAGGGASVTLAKAGTVAVLAGSAISGPAVVDRVADRPPPTAEAASAPARKAKPAAPRPRARRPVRSVRASVAPTAAARAEAPSRFVPRPAAPRRHVGERDEREDDSRGSGRDERPDTSEDRHGDDTPDRAEGDDHSGSGSGGEPDDDRPSSNSGSGSGEAEALDGGSSSSGPGSGSEPDVDALSVATPEPDEESHRDSGSDDGPSH